MSDQTNYLKDAETDAWETVENFLDEIVDQAADGTISDDLFNDYTGGDSYHHENHVDKAYHLSEAAEILDQLSRYEEDDEGLWQGLAPRDAISAQAAYTYGNAVMSEWRDIIEKFNNTLEDIEFLEGEDPEAVRRAFMWLRISLHDFSSDDEIAAKLAQTALDSLLDFNATLVLCDRLEETGKSQSFVTEARELIAKAQEREPVEEEEDA